MSDSWSAGRRRPARRAGQLGVLGARSASHSIIACLTLALVLIVALRGGGSDLVARQEMGIVLLWGFALALAFGVLPRAHPSGAILRALGFGALFVAVIAMSLLSTESSERSYVELARVLVYAGVVTLISFGVSSRSWRAAAAGLAAAALIVPVLAILSRLTPDILEFFGAEILQSRRLLYPLGYWNAVGAWSAMALAVGLAYSVNPRGGGWRVASLALTPFAGLAVYLTYSRGSIVAAILALAMTIYLSRDRRAATIHCATAVFATGLCVLAVRSQPEVANATGEGGALLVLLVVLATSAGCAWVATRSGERGFTRGRQIGRWGPALAVALVCSVVTAIAIGGTGAASQSAGEPQQYPSEGSDPAARLASLDSNRYDIWSSGARAFQSDPLLGVGAGSFEFWWNRDGSGVESVRDAHSLYIETAGELGIPGIIGLLGFLGAVLYGAAHELRRSRSSGDASAFTAMVSAYVIFLVFAGFDWLWEIPAITLFGVSAGVIAAAADSSPRRTRSTKLSGRQLAAVAAAVLAGVALIPNLVATQRVRASSAELAIADYDGAIGEASEAVAAAPWAATSYAQRSLAEVAQGDLAAARADTEAAIDREPTNWRHWGLLAQVSALQGKKGQALEALETARDLSPLPDAFFDAAAARIDRSTDEDITP